MYKTASNQKINYEKPNVLLSPNIDHIEREEMINILGVSSIN